ncbi:hypothetical protein [Flavihumibacter sp. UBA7668]|uniref:hypothetical protein n=1 Tax=Flavihumibacter sp. UBA7668 TaxID=1946542 RepID=UPI0025B9DDD7|nr:hypothetical protein [Flavihumibacter sp. UBA7668]
MKYISIIVGILMGLTIDLNAQIVLQSQLPSPGVFSKAQLWNISIMNSNSQQMNVRLVVTISDLQSNQLVLSGTSRFFLINQGAVLLTQNQLSPISYQTVNANYPVDPQPDGFLPVGIFNICYTLYWQNNDGLETVAEQCETLEVEPLSPPQLILPENEDNIEEEHPFFTWTAPMSTTLISGLRYDWKMVEVLPTQSASDAIQFNVPVWIQRSLPGNSFQYPLSLPKLDSSKLYAWQVTALNNLMPVSHSEIWLFKISRNTEIPGRRKGTYAVLKKNMGGHAVLLDGDIQFVFTNDQNNTNASILLFEIKNGKRQALLSSPIQLPLTQGSNYLRIPLSSINGIRKKQDYILELDDLGKKYYLKFQLTQSK